ncbi:MAG: hypothetical protein OEZ20_02590 [candidate division WOR-3 bacterium]|nr:hypothetical protein [candidate division WOR-3 bacterium]
MNGAMKDSRSVENIAHPTTAQKYGEYHRNQESSNLDRTCCYYRVINYID